MLRAMFDEDLPKTKTTEFPRDLEALSVDELDAYVAELQAEIARCETDKNQKKASAAAADSVFKS